MNVAKKILSMLKCVKALCAFCICLYAIIPITQSFAAGKNPESWQECAEFVKDTVNQVQELNVYYFRLAMCRAEFITDEHSFNAVMDLFKKSTLTSSVSFAPQAYFALGYLYESKYSNGQILFNVPGKPSDIGNAINNYTAASNLGCTLAGYHLGRIYLSDDHDAVKGVFWLIKAAKAGNAAAQYELSKAYRHGIGVKQDNVLAYVWQRVALTTQLQFNKTLTESPIGQRYINTQQALSKSLYQQLSITQQQQAVTLVKDYSQKYIQKAGPAEEGCQAMQTILAGNSLRQTLIRLKSIKLNQ